MPETHALPEDDIKTALKQLPDWHYADQRISRKIRTKDFREAVALIVRIGFLAEEMNHHPEIFNVYNNLVLRLNTHDAGGQVTQKDIDLAARIDQVLSA